MGKYVEWKSYYTVGHPCLDDEHQRILGLIDELYTAMAAGRHNAKTKEILDRLVDYTMSHFEHEEEAMREAGYPQLAAHKVLHNQMRRRTLDLRDNISLVTCHDLLYFLKDWWANHIQTEDRQYAPFMCVECTNVVNQRPACCGAAVSAALAGGTPAPQGS